MTPKDSQSLARLPSGAATGIAITPGHLQRVGVNPCPKGPLTGTHR